ncbi:polymorphic toxin type 50 domain-containing protein, partial [Ralstonia nicotianae]
PNSVVGNILGHVALGCATSSMQGTGCAGGAAGGLAGSVVAPLVGMGLYAGTSGTNSAIDAATVAIGAMAGGAIAHAIGGDTTAGASTAQNAAMNNWLEHRRPNMMVYSEQERRDNAAAACKNDPTQCDAANRWDVVSKQRNAELQAACANLSSDTCRSAMATAQAAGNYIVFAGGKVYAYGKEDPVARSLDPSPAAKTLDTMVGSPLAGIFGGIPYFKSNADPAAGYYFAQYGMALEGIGAGVLGLPTGPLAGPGWRATLESPNTLYVGSAAGSAFPTWTSVAGPYSVIGQGGGAATTVQAGPGYAANDVLRVGSTNGSSNSSATVGQPATNNIPVPDDLPAGIHVGQQGKHIPDHNNFIPGRSTINGNVDPQQLLDGVHSGAYPIIGTSNRGGYPVVDFGRPIGIDANSGLPTQYGTIHYGQNGAHIVPTNPALTGVKR